MITVHVNSYQPANVQELRALLKRQFPEAHRVEPAAPVEKGPLMQTGIPALDAVGLPESGLMELVGAEATGVSLVVWGVIRHLLIAGHAVALVDSGDSCDVVQAWPEEITARLLWVRCRGMEETVRAMDLLVRDGNVRHLIMDLQGAAVPLPGHVPHPVWYRLRNVAEETGMWMLVTSREHIVPCAVIRCHLTYRFGLDDLNTPRETLLERITMEVPHRHRLSDKDPLRQVG